ncbi:MAG: TOBE domain-containing protein, partial [Bacillus sp. (in: firmicutes)]
AKGSVIDFYIRPEKIQISIETSDGLQVRVERKMFLGAKTRYILVNKEKHFIADISNVALNPDLVQEGKQVCIKWNPEDLLATKK